MLSLASIRDPRLDSNSSAIESVGDFILLVFLEYLEGFATAGVRRLCERIEPLLERSSYSFLSCYNEESLRYGAS
jgi:hypothetical protein